MIVKTSRGATVLDRKYTRFGWRQWSINGRELRLNGAKIQLNGDLLHPFGPFIGSRRYAWSWFKMIKDVGGNAARPHAQPRPRFYLDLADEMGIAILDEAAVFGSSISLNFKADVTWRRLENHVDELVRRDRNHASVFGWSPANEMFAQFLRVSAGGQSRATAQIASVGAAPARARPDAPVDFGGRRRRFGRRFADVESPFRHRRAQFAGRQ